MFAFDKQPEEIVTKGVDFADLIPTGITLTGGTVYVTTKRRRVLASAVVDKGSGKVGLPVSSHPYSTGDIVRLMGTKNYDAAELTVDATSTANEVVVTATYVAETFVGTEVIGLDKTALFSAVATPSTTVVNVQLGTGGTPGEQYVVSYFATLSNTDVYEQDVIMRLREFAA